MHPSLMKTGSLMLRAGVHMYPDSNYETSMMVRTLLPVLTPRQSSSVDTIILIVKKLEKINVLV